MNMPSLILFSDLDGSLLDHHDYRFEPARPALERLDALGVPLVLATSKTLAEVVRINRAIGNHQPVIVENGCALCLPTDLEYPFELPPHEVVYDHAVIHLAASYPEIRDFITEQRRSNDWQVRGFGDMTTAEVAAATGLTEDEAECARERLCGEPFTWNDSADNLAVFRVAAAARGMRTTRGGRFYHLTGESDKADAMRLMCDLLASADRLPSTTVALGDGENDLKMLQQADVAVVIQRPDGSQLSAQGRRRTLVSALPGPAGWNSAVQQLLDELDAADLAH